MAVSSRYESFRDLSKATTDQTMHSVASDIQIFQGEKEPDIERGREASEGDALIRRQPQTPGILKKTGAGLRKFGKATATSIYNALAWVITHPILFLIALVTAAPNALYAFTSKPDKIKELLPKMSKWQITFSSAKFLSAFLINAIMNAYFLTTAWKSLKDIFKNLYTKVSEMKSGDPKKILAGIKEITKVFVLFSLALGAAIGVAALSYVSFSWIAWGALLPAITSLGVTFASRLIGVNGIFTRLSQLFSKEAKVQRELTDALNHINLNDPAHKQRMITGFQLIKTQVKESRLQGKDPNYVLDASDLEAIYIPLAKLVSDLNETERNFLLDTTNQEIAMNYFMRILEVFYATSAITFLAIPYGAAFLQKGKDGIDIVLQLTSHLFGANWGLDNATPGEQIATGLPSGIATFMLAASYALKTPYITKRVFHHLCERPQDICQATGLLAANYFGAYSPLSVGRSEVENKKNVFGLRPDIFGSTFEILVMIAGGDINACVSFEKAFLKSKVTIDDLTLKDVVEKLEDTSSHCISKEASETIKTYSRFR